MSPGRHFKDRWKELIASQKAAEDDSSEEQSELDESGLNLVVFVRRHRRGVLVGCLCILAICAAIVHVYPHGSSTGRRPLHGRVQVDGVGIARGSISFLPAEGNSGPAANASIVDGKYSFTKETGPRGGPHRVLIDTFVPPGQGDVPAPEQPMRDMKKTDPTAFRERNAGLGPSAEQPQRSAKRHWEVEYSVPEEGVDRKDFELSG